MDSQTQMKQVVADAAIKEIKSGMILGLGSGSTAALMIKSLADEIRSGKLQNIRGVATSFQSEVLALELDIPLIDLASVSQIDLAIDGADGYTITAGTTPGANDIEDATDLGTSLSYTFTNQVAGANYYYTVNAYNTAGQTSGCAEGSFTTFSTSCYCESIPSSNDGTGIGSLQVGTTDFTSGGDVTYEDFTGTPVDLGQGLTANVQIVFQTGWTYDTNIWIDFNDDFVFDSSEQVFDGVSLADNPTTLEDLSQKYKISRERVRQIENKAFEKLQKHMLNSAKSKNLLPAN